MNRSRQGWMGILFVGLLASPWVLRADDAALARDLQRAYDRCRSRIMVRILNATTHAALDAAAYDRNIVFHYPLDETLSPPAKPLSMSALSFRDALVPGTVVDHVGNTPLTDAERASPLAWQPLVTYLTEKNYDAVEGMLDAGAEVTEEHWGNEDLIRPLQHIAVAHLHGDELWVRVDFRPETAAWLPVKDTDGDRYPECYGRLNPAAINPDILAQIRGDYSRKPLSGEELRAYFHSLTSNWYPSLMTVVLDPAQTRPWPGTDAEPVARDLMKNRVFEDPDVILRSKPFGTFLYNVFILPDGLQQSERQQTAQRPDAVAPGTMPPIWPEPLPPVTDAVANELTRWGGSWDAWTGSLQAFHANVRNQLDARPGELYGLIGREGWLFFRDDLEFLLSGDLRQQPRGRDPFPAIVDFAKQLRERDIDMLLVVIPTKAEVYPDMIAASAPPGGRPYVAPYSRKLLAELAGAGVDCVDLLPVFLEQRDTGGQVYMPQDTHWTPRGLEIAAACIAQRIRDYDWFSDLSAQPVEYTVRSAPCTRLGDICPMLTDAERKPFRPMKLEAHQVLTPTGELYVDDPESPIVMLGDSFTGVFQLEDCRHAGLSAHVARGTGLPVDLIMAHGSGPQIRIRLARRGPDAVASKRLVIWTVIARDLYRYRSPWTPVPLP